MDTQLLLHPGLGGDDCTNGGLFVFVADSAGDLSAGTLYVAKYISAFNETTPGNIKWIKLGHATSAEIEALSNTGSLSAVTTVGGIKENGILRSTTTDPSDASFAEVKLSGSSRWVKLKAGQDKAAAFLETHRYAALKGGGGLIASLVGFASNSAGMVVQHKLDGNQADSDVNLINSDWVPYQSTMLINGAQMAADAMGNTNVVDKISCPDNLKFSEKLRTLFIGEDSGNHVSNFVWAYEVDTGRLQRLLSSPAGAECTACMAWTTSMGGPMSSAASSTRATTPAARYRPSRTPPAPSSPPTTRV